MAFPYEGYSRPVSRRQSMAYPVGYPYNDQQEALYNDGMMPGLVENYPQPSYQIYGPPTAPLNHHITGPAYDDLAVRDSYYPVERQISTVGFPSVIPHTGIGMPHRQRRHSAVSIGHRPPPMDTFRRPSSIDIKFKRKGSFLAGISLRQAQSHIRLSNNDSYTIHDFHADYRGRILLKIRWAGYSSLTYEIPLEDYDGRVSLRTLARRIARACVHYLQANIIPVAWDRVELHRIEEIATGTWQPVLSAR